MQLQISSTIFDQAISNARLLRYIEHEPYDRETATSLGAAPIRDSLGHGMMRDRRRKARKKQAARCRTWPPQPPTTEARTPSASSCRAPVAAGPFSFIHAHIWFRARPLSFIVFPALSSRCASTSSLLPQRRRRPRRRQRCPESIHHQFLVPVKRSIHLDFRWLFPGLTGRSESDPHLLLTSPVIYNHGSPARRKGKAPENNQPCLFPLHVLQQATNNFDKDLVIGVGGFGDVYLGELKCGTKVAVKQKKMATWQGQREFQAEIELLARLKHPNLVALIGYCDEENEMILVYEYMENGTLKSHLYGSDKPSLNWPERLEVCVGSARGLHYLHTSSEKGIIHRDIKSENILLGEKLCAKIADFGLSKDGPGLNETHVITQVKGTPGYLDPEYYDTLQLTQKSDVYFFGVVLLEVLCGRSAIDLKLPKHKVNLARWVTGMLKNDQLEQIVDQKILGTISPHSLMIFCNTVLKCLAENAVDRPSMEEVLWDLEQELEYVHGSIISAGVSAESSDDEFYHDASSRLVRPGEGKVLTRSLAIKAYKRASNMPPDSSAPSTSRPVARAYQGQGGNNMNGFLELHSIQESLSEAANSHESGRDFTFQPIRQRGGKTLTRSLGKAYERDDDL